MDFFTRLQKALKWSFIINIAIIIIKTVLFGFAGLYFSIIVSIPVFILLTFWFMLIGKKKDRTDEKAFIQPKEQFGEFYYKMREAKNRLINIKKNSDEINFKPLSDQVYIFIVESDKLIEICKEEDYKYLIKFFNYCIPTVLESLVECNKYKKLDINNEEIINYRKKIVSSISNMNKIVVEAQNYCVKRQTDDVEVELKTVQTLFEVEGFIEKTEEN